VAVVVNKDRAISEGLDTEPGASSIKLTGGSPTMGGGKAVSGNVAHPPEGKEPNMGARNNREGSELVKLLLLLLLLPGVLLEEEEVASSLEFRCEGWGRGCPGSPSSDATAMAS